MVAMKKEIALALTINSHVQTVSRRAYPTIMLVIMCMIVRITVTKQTTVVCVILNMNLNVTVVDASTARGFVMEKKIVLMEAMKAFVVLLNHQVRTGNPVIRFKL